MPELIVVGGPIASGKSTVAGLVGERLRAAGREVAVVDLDDVVDLVGGFVGLTEPRFRAAQEVFGELVAAWLGRGFDVVAHGSMSDEIERHELFARVPADITRREVRLHSTYEQALIRVADDPTRILSKDPELLRGSYERHAARLPALPPSDWTFDTTTTTAEAIVDEIAAALSRSGG